MLSNLSTSRVREVVVFLRLGAGMRHSMEKAVQFVHGMPREAASQRTYLAVMRWSYSWPATRRLLTLRA
jgi:hypothetical protein